MTGLRVTTVGLERLEAKVTRRVNFLGGPGMRAVFQEAARELLIEYKTQVETFTPGPVRDLKPATKVRKQREVGFIYPILRRTGDMLQSMVAKVHYTSAWAIRVTFPGVNRKGTRNQVVAKAHIEGTARLPVRDFTKVSRAWGADQG